MNYDLLLRLINEQGLSRRKLALQAGVPPTTLNSAINSRTKHFPHEYIVKLAQVLGVRWFDLYDTTENEDWISYMTPTDWMNAANASSEDRELIAQFDSWNDKKNIDDMITIMKQLNQEGQKTAITRVQELTEIKRYRKDEGNEEST